MERKAKKAVLYPAENYPARSVTKRNVLVKRVAIRAEKSQLRRQKINAVLSDFCESIGMERSSLTWCNIARIMMTVLLLWMMACLMV